MCRINTFRLPAQQGDTYNSATRSSGEASQRIKAGALAGRAAALPCSRTFRAARAPAFPGPRPPGTAPRGPAASAVAMGTARVTAPGAADWWELFEKAPEGGSGSRTWSR